MNPWNIPRPLHRLVSCASLLLAFGLSLFHTARAQDIHFSMLDIDPLLFNPAYAAFYDGTARFGAIYRNQWATVSAPFQTLAATAEANVMRIAGGKGGLGAGLWLNTDRAGTLGYGSTSVSAIVSFYHTLDRYANHLVSVALEGGMGQARFNTDRMRLPDADESFDRTQSLYPTLGMGVAWFWQISEALYTKVGASVRNLNQPDISYTGLDSSPLLRHWNLYLRAEWRLRPDWGLLPLVAYQQQSNYSELLYGCDLRWYLNQEQGHYLALGAGIVARHGDAATIDLGVEWNAWTFAFAYDANYSTLAPASHTLGAFEVAILYKLLRQKARNPKTSMPCPIF